MATEAQTEREEELALDAPLANSLALESRASALMEVSDATGLVPALDASQRRGLPLLPLGAGSNVVLPPHIDALVLQSGDSAVDIIAPRGSGALVRVGAGKDWHGLVCWSVENGFTGLENLALIPGNVGAAPVQNIGAYGRELEEFVEAVHGFHLENGSRDTLSRQDCAFAYRSSVFKTELRDRFVITAVDFCLPTDAAPVTHYPALAERLAAGAFPGTAAGIRDAVVELRRERLPDPRRAPNAGSFFKNPVVEGSLGDRLRERYPRMPCHPQPEGRVKLSAAWLIDRCDLRGHSMGAAAVSKQHALVLENRGGANQSDVLALAAAVRTRVTETYGVSLEVEPRVYARDGRIEEGW